jgi:hypothetical protein
MSKIFVLRTNIGTKEDVEKVAPLLNRMTEISRWNFDLQDCDCILRIQAEQLNLETLDDEFRSLGFACMELPDE